MSQEPAELGQIPGGPSEAGPHCLSHTVPCGCGSPSAREGTCLPYLAAGRGGQPLAGLCSSPELRAHLLPHPQLCSAQVLTEELLGQEMVTSWFGGTAGAPDHRALPAGACGLCPASHLRTPPHGPGCWRAAVALDTPRRPPRNPHPKLGAILFVESRGCF